MDREQGLSLVELMIAILLGSLLTIAATQLFLVNRQTENLHMGIAGVQDNGRFAFDYISRSLMGAGMHPDEPVVPFILDGTPFNSTNPELAEIQDDAQFDEIAFAVNEGTNCYGNPFTGYKRFRVITDSGIQRLVCAAFEYTETTAADGSVSSSWVSGGGPLIDNVEAFQVLYGLDFNDPHEDGYGTADLYTNATQVKAMESDINAGNVRIVSVRFSVLIASDARVTLDPDLALDSIDVLDVTYTQGTGGGTEIDFEDGRLYRTYSSTVAIRNLVSGL